MEKLEIKDYLEPDETVTVEPKWDAQTDAKKPIVMLTANGMGGEAVVLLDRAGVNALWNWIAEWLMVNPTGRTAAEGSAVAGAPCIVPYEPLEDKAPSAAVCAAPPLTGTLRYARWEPEHRRAPCLTGQVYGHKRFPAGSVVWTSRVVEHLGGNLFRTLSGSIYAVEWDAGNAGDWPASIVRKD